MSQKTAVPRQERLEENGFPSTYHEAGPHVGAYEATNRQVQAITALAGAPTIEIDSALEVKPCSGVGLVP